VLTRSLSFRVQRGPRHRNPATKNRVKSNTTTTKKMIHSTTEQAGKTTRETRTYISSAPLDIDRIAAAIRGHWGVESMHWILDVQFKDDLSRYRQGHGAKNMAVVRRFALATQLYPQLRAVRCLAQTLARYGNARQGRAFPTAPLTAIGSRPGCGSCSASRYVAMIWRPRSGTSRSPRGCRRC
jgi:predicted transposase YbfD/YdcC